jgi:hypothetical protein
MDYRHVRSITVEQVRKPSNITIMNERQLSPYRQAVQAHRDGLWYDSNPFPLHSAEYKQWERGMRDACADFYLD